MDLEIVEKCSNKLGKESNFTHCRARGEAIAGKGNVRAIDGMHLCTCTVVLRLVKANHDQVAVSKCKCQTQKAIQYL